jgi:RTX calcium-binding nonapeptide repeat (4 copies)
MRRTATILAAIALMVTFSSGVALAAYEDSITGTNHTDILSGTRQAEQISGLGGGDQINGGGGSDLVEGGMGPDELSDGLGQDTVYGGAGVDNVIGYGDSSVDNFYAGGGDDTVQSRDIPSVKDVVNCGAGTDTVYADKDDVVSGNCERVRTR